MGHADYAKIGDNNVICDRCGFKFKASENKFEWTGYYVCNECWDYRHPQDFVTGVRDNQVPAVSRPESPDKNVGDVTPDDL